MSGTQIHAYLRAPSAAKQHEHVGPFVARFTPGNDHPMLNYAIPDDGARPTSNEIEALVEAFRQRGLTPRLEYAADAAPDLEQRLVHSGFDVEARYPLMWCRPAEAPMLKAPENFIVTRAETDLDHTDAIAVADEAYGETGPPPSLEAVTARQHMSAAGGAVVLARQRSTGLAAGSGLFPAPREHISELAAVGTREAFRRRGIATAVTSLLVHLALDSEIELLWLTPEHEHAERIYAKAGFTRLGGTMVHLSRPTKSPTP
jgi:GNAT superfamily N-acetyltransferase